MVRTRNMISSPNGSYYSDGIEAHLWLWFNEHNQIIWIGTDENYESIFFSCIKVNRALYTLKLVQIEEWLAITVLKLALEGNTV